MPKTNFATVDAYIAAQPEQLRPLLQRLRAILSKALPEASEVISYQIPAYRIPEGVIMYFAAWKSHYSIYPALTLAKAFEQQLAPYEVTKGTIRFPIDKPVPAKLIAALAKFRAHEVRTRAAAKRAKPGRTKPAAILG
jgi:uncharacterized protein YdhG (YjbR/CyaY superfamily)